MLARVQALFGSQEKPQVADQTSQSNSALLKKYATDNRVSSFAYCLDTCPILPSEAQQLAKNALSEGQGEILNAIAKCFPDVVTNQMIDTQLSHPTENNENLMYTLVALRDKNKLANPLQRFFSNQQEACHTLELKFFDQDNKKELEDYFGHVKKCIKQNGKLGEPVFYLHTSVPYEGTMFSGKLTRVGSPHILRMDLKSGGNENTSSVYSAFRKVFPEGDVCLDSTPNRQDSRGPRQ